MLTSHEDFVYATYRNLRCRSLTHLGGVVQIDAATNEVLWNVRLKSPTRVVVNEQTGNVFVLHEEGIEKISPDGTSHRLVSHLSANGNDVWYSLGIDPVEGHLLIGNARSFVIDGEVLRYLVRRSLR